MINSEVSYRDSELMTGMHLPKLTQVTSLNNINKVGLLTSFSFLSLACQVDGLRSSLSVTFSTTSNNER
jgi:hypothetical protein